MSSFQTYSCAFLLIIWCSIYSHNPLAQVRVRCQSSLRYCTFTCRNIPGRSQDVIIDLSTLDNTDGDPRFRFIRDADGRNYYYEWNPCTQISRSITSSCIGSNVCQVDGNRPGVAYGIGSQLDVFFEDGRFVMKYESDNHKATDVILAYESRGEDRTSEIKEGPTDHYTMTLFTRYAPRDGNDGGGGGGISTGTVVVIIFFSVLILYFGIGIAFLKHRRAAQGKDMIPNYKFWSSIPGLVKDGCKFSAEKAKECLSNAKGKTGEYEKI